MIKLKDMQDEVMIKLSEHVQNHHVLKPVKPLIDKGYDQKEGCFKFLSEDAEGVKILYRVFPYHMNVTEENEDNRGTEWVIGELA